MRRHPEYGASLIGPVGFLQPARDVVACHHERWDGSGYPRGLSGNSIPLAARIFAVADVFDALTSERPYHRAMTLTAARQAIAREAGTTLDPTVVRSFLRIPQHELSQVARDTASDAVRTGSLLHPQGSSSMNRARMFAPLVLLATSVLFGCNLSSGGGAARTPPPPTGDPRLQEVASRLLCPCGRCGPMTLAECGCEMPNGAVAVKAYVSTLLDNGASVDEAASMVVATFHARKAQ